VELKILFTEYLSYLSHEENVSPNTVEAYSSDLKAFLFYLDTQGVKKVTELDHLHIRTYIATLYEKLDKRSIARKTSSIRAFLRYLNMQGYTGAQILSRIIRPKMPEKLMFALSVEEMNTFLSAIDPSTDIGKRNLAIIELLYGAGLRVSELANLKIEDIDVNDKIIKVMGKGRKERLSPFNDEALNSLNRYFEVRGNFVKEDKPSNIIFLNRSGTPLNVRSIQRLTRFISLKAGILKKTTPHTMRHSYATHLLEAGASIKTVKELLGHASIAATQKYTHLTMEKLSEMYKKTHPKA
jgi:integrase/recombinase XerC